MSSSETLAEYSNLFVYSAMAVFAIVFVLFSVVFAKKTNLQQSSVDVSDTKVPVGAGVGASAAPLAAGAASAQIPVGDGAETADTSASDGQGNGRRTGNIAFALTWLATGLLAAGIIARGFSSGRPPLGNMYEYSLMIAFATSVLFLVLATRTDVRWLGALVSGAVLLILGSAVTILYTDSAPLVPALKSYWLLIHVSSIMIASGAFTVGALVTMMYLVRDRAERKADGKPVTGTFVSKLPSAKRLDTLSYRIYAFTFPLWTFAVIAGAIWAEAAWGRYWGWDPKETWAFITWVVFAGYLHARATAGWSGRKAAIIALIGFATIIINYFAVNFLASGLHSYAGV